MRRNRRRVGERGKNKKEEKEEKKAPYVRSILSGILQTERMWLSVIN
jgi:hypothetical protein